MIVFGLIIGLVVFLLLLAYFSQREQRNEMIDDENYIEPEIVELEKSEESEDVVG